MALTPLKGGGHDPLRVQVREGTTEVRLADGHAQGRLSQDRGGSWQGGVAPDPAFRPGALWHGLGKFCSTPLRAPPDVSHVAKPEGRVPIRCTRAAACTLGFARRYVFPAGRS